MGTTVAPTYTTLTMTFLEETNCIPKFKLLVVEGQRNIQKKIGSAS